jgi:LEA14-like dessication related protein
MLRIILLLVSFLLMSCSTWISKIATPPRIVEQTLNVTGGNLQQVDLDLVLDIENPNPIDLPIESLSADLKISGEPFLTKSWERLPALAAGKRTLIHLPFTLAWKDLWNVGANLFNGARLPYEATGLVRVKGLSVPFNKNGFLAVQAHTK